MIKVGDAVVKLGLDKTQFSEGMKKVGDETETATKRMQTSMRIAAVAITAVGLAGLKLVADARKMNAELGQVALTTGTTTAEMRRLALELSNVTFRLNSVISTLSILTRAGIINEDQLRDTANAFDAIADATGSSAEAMAEMLIPAFKFFGLELPRTAEELDRLTWLNKKTIISFTDFASAMDYVAAYGTEMDITLQGVVSIMAIMAERGQTGSAVTRLFRTAISEAAREGIGLNEALGISNELLAEYNEKIGVEAVGMTQVYADVANEQFGIMDKLASAWEDLTLKMGSFLTPLEPVFALMSALGPIILALSLTSLPQLAASLKESALWLGKYVVKAALAVKSNIALAASKIWAWASSIPFAGIAIAIGGVAALIASIALIRAKATEAVEGLKEGGIVTRPIRTLIGEAGPEAVIPLSKAGLPMGTRELHIHIGNYMGDETSLRQFGRKLSQILQEEGRRNAFGQVQSGYYFGRSSP